MDQVSTAAASSRLLMQDRIHSSASYSLSYLFFHQIMVMNEQSVAMAAK